jgi:hypothetical protein
MSKRRHVETHSLSLIAVIIVVVIIIIVIILTRVTSHRNVVVSELLNKQLKIISSNGRGLNMDLVRWKLTMTIVGASAAPQSSKAPPFHGMIEKKSEIKRTSLIHRGRALCGTDALSV